MSTEKRIKTYRTTDPVYRSFVSMLRRKGVKNYGLLASLYFDVFFVEAFRIKKELLVNKGFCAESSGSFSAWRKEQKRLELLDWTEVKLPNGKVRVDYKPGIAAISYLNSATISSQQLATKDDVRNVRFEISELSERVSALEAAMDNIIERFDPPTTKDKRVFYTQHPDKIRLM